MDKGTVVNARGKNGATALMYTAGRGQKAAVQVLLDKGADANAKDKGGFTALMAVSLGGNANIARTLIAKGADVNAKSDREYGRTPLMLAAMEGRADIVQALLTSDADVNTSAKTKLGYLGWTALMDASTGGYTDIVQALLAKGADVNAKMNNGVTALMQAVFGGHTATAQALLGADVMAKDTRARQHWCRRNRRVTAKLYKCFGMPEQRNNMKKILGFLGFLLLLSGCAVYFDPSDEYVRGLRWFDRGAFEQAKNLWIPLANAGDCDAQFRLGTLYLLGAGVPQSDETARHWFLAAANQGQAFAQGLLAVMHAHDTTSIRTIARTVVFDCTIGCGIEKNMMEAYKWARLSEKFAVYDGHRDGQRERVREMLVKYSQSLNPEQIAEAKQQAQDWEPSPSQCNQRKLL